MNDHSYVGCHGDLDARGGSHRRVLLLDIRACDRVTARRSSFHSCYKFYGILHKAMELAWDRSHQEPRIEQ